MLVNNLVAIQADPLGGAQLYIPNIEHQRIKLEENIAKACNEFLSEPNWEINMSIWDTLNHTPYLCPFAIQAIRKQLKTKNPEIELLALHLTESIIKNCPASHAAVAQPDFIRYLVKMGLDQRKDGVLKSLEKKIGLSKEAINEQHLHAQTIDKALLLLQMLYEAYKESELYPIFRETYRKLSQQGVRFPKPTKDETIQIFTPYKEYNNNGFSGLGSIPQNKGNGQIIANYAIVDRNLPMISRPTLIPNIQTKELQTMQENASFLFSIINSTEVGSNLRENELIQQIVQQLQVQQQSVIARVAENNGPELFIDEGLKVNEIVVQVLQDYEDLIANRKRRYEESIGDIEDLEDNNDNKDDDDNDNDGNNDNDNKDNNAKDKSDDKDKDKTKANKSSTKINDADLILLPPPNASHKQQTSQDLKNVGKKNQDEKITPKNSQQDILGIMFDDINTKANNNNNNNNKNNSSNNIFDPLNSTPQLSKKASTPQLLNKTSTPLASTDSSSKSPISNNNTNTTKTGNGDPFSQMDDPFANFVNQSNNNNNNTSNNTKNNINKNNTSTTSVIASQSSKNVLSMNNASTNTTTTKPKEDTLSQLENPFDMLDMGNSNNNNKNINNNQSNNNQTKNPFDLFDPLTNNNNNANNNKKKDDDFLGDRDPFAGFP